jgi:hypothetical protein
MLVTARIIRIVATVTAPRKSSENPPGSLAHVP